MTDDVNSPTASGEGLAGAPHSGYDSYPQSEDPSFLPDVVQQGLGAAAGAVTGAFSWFSGAIEETVGNENHLEDPSAISQEDRDKLKPFIFNSPKVFQYPQNLTDSVPDSPEQLHSVRFTINVRENSRVADLTNRNLAGFYTQLEEAPNRSEQNRRTAEQLQTIVKGTTAVAAVGAGLSVIGGKKGKNANGALLIGGLSAFVGASAIGGIVETVKTLRTLGMIDLYISQPPVAKYSANWENKELGALAGLSDAAASATDFVELLKSTKGLGELALRGTIQAAANLPAGLGITGDIGSSFELASSKVANPYKEQLFNYIDFRQFAFAYKFTPRNPSEYDNIKNIIRLFKYHMHPENDPTGLFLEYPSEFDITYLYKGEENKELNKISTCALTDMKVTYGNQDAFTTIKDTKRPGAPAEINMELAFTELEALTNDRIADGL